MDKNCYSSLLASHPETPSANHDHDKKKTTAQQQGYLYQIQFNKKRPRSLPFKERALSKSSEDDLTNLLLDLISRGFPIKLEYIKKKAIEIGKHFDAETTFKAEKGWWRNYLRRTQAEKSSLIQIAINTEKYSDEELMKVISDSKALTGHIPNTNIWYMDETIIARARKKNEIVDCFGSESWDNFDERFYSKQAMLMGFINLEGFFIRPSLILNETKVEEKENSFEDLKIFKTELVDDHFVLSTSLNNFLDELQNCYGEVEGRNYHLLVVEPNHNYLLYQNVIDNLYKSRVYVICLPRRNHLLGFNYDTSKKFHKCLKESLSLENSFDLLQTVYNAWIASWTADERIQKLQLHQEDPFQKNSELSQSNGLLHQKVLELQKRGVGNDNEIEKLRERTEEYIKLIDTHQKENKEKNNTVPEIRSWTTMANDRLAQFKSAEREGFTCIYCQVGNQSHRVELDNLKLLIRKNGWLKDDILFTFLEKLRLKKDNQTIKFIDSTHFSNLVKVIENNQNTSKATMDGRQRRKRKKKGFDIDIVHTLLVFLNQSNLHWTLVKISRNDSLITFYDTYAETIPDFEVYVKKSLEVMRRLGNLESDDWINRDYTVDYHFKEKIQDNAYDCGVFVAAIAEMLYFNRRVPTNNAIFGEHKCAKNYRLYIADTLLKDCFSKLGESITDLNITEVKGNQYINIE